ncbi:MAG: response regulator transcription factor [Gemmatimonadetes bacterium]|nr:response regulator transcription factor [Gemmatimonadota bacterium]
MKIRALLLVEDVRPSREMLQHFLNQQPDMHVVATPRDARAAIIRARDLDPDVVLLGTLRDETDRAELVREIRVASPSAAVVVMDFHQPAGAVVEEFTRAGAHGFILRDTPMENLLYVIRVAATGPDATRGNGPLSLITGNGSVDGGHGNGSHAGRDAIPQSSAPHLTRRELEIAELIGQGHSNKEIARVLELSLHTVKTHVRRIMEKLGLHSRVGIAGYAYRERSLKRAGLSLEEVETALLERSMS